MATMNGNIKATNKYSDGNFMILTLMQNVSNLRHWPVAASCNKVTFLTKDIANNFDPWQKCKATLIYNWSCKDGR